MTTAHPIAPILRGVAPAALWLLVACAGVSEAMAVPSALDERGRADDPVTELAPWLSSAAPVAWSSARSAVSDGDPVHGTWSAPDVYPLAPPVAGATIGIPSSFAADYDSNRHRVIGYAGELGTWVLALESGQERWEKLPTGGPTPGNLVGHTAVFDPQGDRLIVFGGATLNGRPSGQVWSLDLTPEPVWRLLLPDVEDGPGPRSFHMAVFDPPGRRMIVIGGTASGPVTEIWALSLNGEPSWSRIDIAGTVPWLWHSSAARYDPVGDRLVVVGNRSFEVWALSLRGEPTWRLLAPTPDGYPTLDLAAILLDPGRNRLVSIGGSGRVEDLRTGLAEWPSVFSFDEGKWRTLSWQVAGHGPPPRVDAAVAYDPVGDRAVFFGGWGASSFFDDTWALEFSPEWRWRRLAPRPTPRFGYAIAMDADGDRLIAAGGGVAWPALFEIYRHISTWTDGTLWALEAEGDRARWKPLGSHESRGWDPRLIHDSGSDAVIALGGQLPELRFCYWPYDVVEVRQYLHDSWRAELDAQPMAAVPLPIGDLHEGHAVAIDRLRRRVLVHGGSATTLACDAEGRSSRSTVTFDRLLAIRLAAPFEVETLQVQESGPGPRTHHHIFYDEDRDRAVLFDGIVGEIWALDLAEPLSWTLLARTTVFGVGHRAIYDPVRERIVVIVGDGPVEAWAVGLDGSSRQLLPGGAAITAGREVQAAYDEARDRIVIHGPRADQVAYLTFGTPLVRVSVAPQPGPSAGAGNAEGLLAVAILSAGGFDAATIIPESVTFGGTAAVRPRGAGAGLAVARDVDGDGRSDLILWFRIGEIDLSADRIRLDGLTSRMEAIRGYGSIASREAARTVAAVAAVAPPMIAHGVSATVLAGTAVLRATYALPRAGMPVFRLLDVGGRRVREWQPGTLGAGRHELRFDVTGLASGVYFLRVEAGKEAVTTRVAIVH